MPEGEPSNKGVDFIANLIVLESNNIDIILGKEMEFVAESVVIAKGVANCAKVNQLDASQGSDVPVVDEFPDVFPEELPGMPPDRDIEFVIELKPGTTPIYKTPYRMATLE
jgi:hypothetical protein